MTKTERSTKETNVRLTWERTGDKRMIKTPDGFLNHMLDTLARYAGWGLDLEASSHDGVDHHLAEDVAIALGRALGQAIEAAPVARYGHAVVAMDDALVETVVDVGGRAYYDGALPMPMMEHVLRSLAFEAGMTLHVDVRRGRDAHHVTEAAFKGLGMGLRSALAPAAETQSTKGAVRYRG